MSMALPPLAAEDFVCEPCGISYERLSVAAAVELTSALPEEYGVELRAMPDARARLRPDEFTWSAIEYACHVRDVYASFTIRLYRTIHEDHPTLEPMLNDLRAARFAYRRRDVSAVVGEIDDNVVGFVEQVARVKDGQWDRQASRLPGENRTARWLVRQAAHEGAHHLADLRAVAQRVQ